MRSALLALCLFAQCLAAQEKDLRGPVRLGLIPDPLYVHLPALSLGEGFMVEAIEKDCVAYRAGLRQWDLLVRLNDKAIAAQKEALASLEKRLLEPDSERCQITVFRAGKSLTLGFPVSADTPEPAKAVLKPEGPPAVSVQAQPMGDNKLQVTVFFRGEDSGKLKKVTCTGTISEVESQVKSKLRTERVSAETLDLIDAALSRLRELQPMIVPKEGMK